MLSFLLGIASFEFRLKVRNTSHYLTGDVNNTTVIGGIEDADTYALKATDDPKYYNIIVPDKDDRAMDIPYNSQELYYYTYPHNKENQKWTMALAQDGSTKIMVMGKCLEYMPSKNRFMPQTCDETKSNQFYEVEDVDDDFPLARPRSIFGKKLFNGAEELKRRRMIRVRRVLSRIFM